MRIHLILGTLKLPTYEINLLIFGFREELALIENRILEKEMAAKRRAERLAKNIAVRLCKFHSFSKTTRPNGLDRSAILDYDPRIYDNT